MTSEITAAEWKALYEAAAGFREIEPWAWVTEQDIFGVQNPKTGEIGYCCIMGELGQLLGMAVYLGTGGLKGYLMLQSEEMSPDDSDAMFIQDCIIVSFENKSALEKKDKDLIKRLGIQAKGKRTWPVFRRHKPGFVPWFLEKAEVLFLTAVLEQARDICLRIGKDEDLLVPPIGDAYLISVYDRGRDGWADKWLSPAPLPEKTLQTAVPDELALQRIKKNARPSKAVWEIDTFHVPSPVFEGERPLYPIAVIIVDKESGYIHDVYLAAQENAPSEFLGLVLSCIEKSGILPSEILVKRPEVADLLCEVSDTLGITLCRVSKLPAVDEARKAMEHSLLKKGSDVPDPEDADDNLEKLIEKSGAKTSIYGLYGLIYGCLAAPGLVMPSALLEVIFGESGAAFESEVHAQKTMDGIMDLWNHLNQWDAKKEEIIIPVYEYPLSRDGILQRSVDALELVNHFLDGLELGGFDHASVPSDLEEDFRQLQLTAELVYVQASMIKRADKPGKMELKGTVNALEKAEFIIDGCITNIFGSLKQDRLHAPGRPDKIMTPNNIVPLPARRKVGRNDPCPCGSGKKYKKCCETNHGGSQ